jgi:hypothetical protein
MPTILPSTTVQQSYDEEETLKAAQPMVLSHGYDELLLALEKIALFG